MQNEFSQYSMKDKTNKNREINGTILATWKKKIKLKMNHSKFIDMNLEIWKLQSDSIVK